MGATRIQGRIRVFGAQIIKDKEYNERIEARSYK